MTAPGRASMRTYVMCIGLWVCMFFMAVYVDRACYRLWWLFDVSKQDVPFFAVPPSQHACPKALTQRALLLLSLSPLVLAEVYVL